MLAKVRTSRAVRLDLHADPIPLRRYGTRERKAAIKRPAGHCLKTQNHVLARESSWQRLAVEAAHRQRQDVGRLVIDRRHCERTKSWCNWMRSRGWRETRVSAPSGGGVAV